MNFNSYFTIKHTSNLRILLLTLFFIVPLGTIYGQNQLITIAGKNITLLKAFDAIESQTQLSITYSRTKIDVNRTLSVDFKKQKLSIVLDKLLAGTGFTYKIEKGYIVLVPVPVKQEQTEATSKKIQGVIVDTNGDPVIGASIQEKGVAGKGTVSDLDGKFNLSVASNAVLLISYIGFQSLEVKVGNRTSLSLVLKEDHQLLDEVVVIGYGTMEKRAVTSSITSISSKDLVTGLGGSTIATALKGKISVGDRNHVRRNSFYLHTLTLEAASQATFNIPAAPWSGFLCQPDFFQTYAEQDLRRSQSWLYGPQVDLSGKDLGFEYTPVFPEEKYYNSNGGRGTYDGARCWKWHYQTDGSLKEYTVSMDNDFAIFRYADVVLMYVEALVRQNRTSEAIQLADFKKIRTRAGLDAYTTSQLTIDELYAERGRELAWEGWRHEDMIRFGKYLKKYWAHPDQSSETFRNVFPIPTDILNANPKLSQNKDY